MLRSKYCPPIDEALFFAIVADYEDLDDAEQLRECLTILDQLKADASTESEDVTFDPSGSGGGIQLDGHDERQNQDSRSSNDEASQTHDMTSVISAFSEMRWSDFDDIDDSDENPTLDSKCAKLMAMFPAIDIERILVSLKLHKEIFAETVEELLTVSFPDDEDITAKPEPTIHKGVEAFFRADDEVGKRKGRKKDKLRSKDVSRASSVNSASSKNPWVSVEDHIGFLAQKTIVSEERARKAYKEAGRSLAGTVRLLSLEEAHKYPGLDSLNDLTTTQLIDLKHDFDSLTETMLFGLLSISRVPSEASELATILVTNKPEEELGRRNDLVQYAPISLNEDSDKTGASPSPWTLVESSTPRVPSAHEVFSGDLARGQASAASRRARSDHLMGGATAVYSERARESAIRNRANLAAAANARVQANGIKTDGIDLHGVTVQHAVRIAKEKAHQWWEGLGETRHTAVGREAMAFGYQIVTGLGTHSANGVPKIGPAVSKSLMKEGWDLSFQPGRVVVHGRRKKR